MKNIILLLLIIFNLKTTLAAQAWKNWNTLNSPLTTDQIFDLATDTDNNLWLTTFDGVMKFDGINWEIFNVANSPLPDNICYSIAIEGNTIWVGSVRGLVKIDSIFNWTIYNSQNSGLPFDNITSIDIDQSGNKWLGTLDQFGFDGGGLTKFDNINWSTFNTNNSPIVSNIISDSFTDRSGANWIGTNLGLSRLSSNLWDTFTPINSGLADYSIGVIKEDQIDSIFWIGTKNGLSKFDLRNNSWTTYDTSNYLPTNWIADVVIDSLNNKWFTSYNRGLVKYDNLSWTIFDSSSVGFFMKYAQKICLDKNGGIWTNTGYGLVYYGDTLLLNVGKENLSFQKSNSVFLYPNPTTDQINLINGTHQMLKSISIFNVQGEIVFESYLNDSSIAEKYHLALPFLSKGVYFVKSQFTKSIVVNKIIISNL